MSPNRYKFYRVSYKAFAELLFKTTILKISLNGENNGFHFSLCKGNLKNCKLKVDEQQERTVKSVKRKEVKENKSCYFLRPSASPGLLYSLPILILLISYQYIIRNGCRLDTTVYRKPTDTGLLLHYHSHVVARYKRSLLNTMLNRAFKLSSTWKFFHEECERLREIFSRLRYPDDLVQSTIRQFIESKVSEDSHTQVADKREAPIRIVLPFKDQKSANVVRKQLADLSRKINADISPVYTSRKIKDEIKVKEDKPPLVSQQCVVYSFQCSLCDAGYVGYTCRHLHQRIEEHKGSAIGNHLREQHDMEPEDIAQSFRILRTCQNKFDCLIFEILMFFIQELKPTLNKQCDSICAKLFV
ncbi:uncharacterized protein [Porites lutea]|uniref:uncharacterized protein n=1 Tax=Porites lutea TaxID=51062 RepID=UPI003CC602EA